MEFEVKNYRDLLNALAHFTHEQLMQPVQLAVLDEPNVEVKYISTLDRDIYRHKNDMEDSGDLESLKEMHGKEFKKSNYIKVANATDVFLFDKNY